MTVWPVALSGVFAVLALVFVYEGLRARRRLGRYLVEGVTVSGQVIEIVSDLVNEDLAARVRYAIGGTTYTIELRAPERLQVGHAVALRYLPSEPGRARRDYPGFVWKESLGYLIGAALLAVAAAVLGLLALLGVL